MDRFKGKGQAPTRFRISTLAKDAPAPKVDREAKVLRGVSAIARGPALGHGIFVDSQMVSQVVEAGNAAKGGVKSRFTHPGLSSDGLGTLLGRAKDFRKDGDRAVADLHLLDSAATSPKGDLAGYVLDLAEESPDLAGFSIVFSRDLDAEDAFIAENSVAQGDDDIFLSPDEMNTRNLPHARLAALHDVDLVDEPAANAAGMFSAPDVLIQGREALLYALSLSDEKPDDTFAGYDPERIRRFCVETLAHEGFAIVPVGEIQREGESDMNDSEKQDAMGLSGDSPPDPVAQERERASRIRELAKDCDQVDLGNQLIDDGTDAVFACQKILAAQGKALAELAKMPDPALSLLQESPGAPPAGPNPLAPVAPSEPGRDGYDVKFDRVEALCNARPGLSVFDAAIELSRIDAQKVRA